MPGRENIFYYADINKCLEDYSTLSLVWACDVLHHLSKSDYIDFFNKSIKSANIIIIKDIDMNHKLGNYINRMHDKIINKEDINDIDPNDIKEKLEENGFKTFYYYLPKLWYPHFIIIGIRK